MKKITLLLLSILLIPFIGNSQCTTTNATGCVCASSGSSNCDLLPDIIVGRPPLTASGTYGNIEYSQSGNGANNGRLRISVSSPNIGHGPLEVRTTNRYVCGTDTITGTAPATCPNTGLPPKQLVVQRVYHKNGNTMTYTDRDAGTMTYHPTHGHMHVDDWGLYSLRQQTSDPNPLNWPIIGNGAKLAFCLMDYGSCSTYAGHCVDANNNTLLNGNFPNYGLGGGSYNCSPTVQGISSGYTDIYYQHLDGMWIDLPPGTCNGNYFIVVQLDPYNYFLEENENNNIIVVPYTLTQQAPGSTASITTSNSNAVCAGTVVTLSANTGVGNTYLWSNGATTQNINVTTPGNYVVTVSSPTCGSAVSAPQNVSYIGETPVTTDATICGSGSATLNATANGATINWFDVASGGAIMGSGTSFNTPAVNNTTTYYAEATVTAPGFSGYAPPNANTIGSGAYFTGSQYLIFDALQSFNLASVKVYANAATSTTVELRNSSGTLLNSATFSIPSGASRINLNWTIPTGSDYQLTRSGSASLYRNSAGVNYPYTIPNYVSIKNSSAGTAYYYFFYDWEVTLQGQTCVSARVPATLNVNANPTINITGNNSICEGSSTNLTASGANTYAWTPSLGLSATNVASVNATPASTTTYVVTGTNAFGCSSSQTVTVNVNSNPVVTVSNDIAMCAGGTTPISAFGANTYLWTPSTGLDVTNVASVNASPASTTTYMVTGTNALGCSASQNVTVTINPLPVVTLSAFADVCVDASNFNLSGGSPSGGTYSGTGVTAGSFSATTAGIGTHAITYTYADGNGCEAAAVQNILVKSCNCIIPSTPPFITGAAQVCKGSTVSFSVNNNANVTNYNWVAPANATIASGQGTNAVTVSFAANYTAGNLCVAAGNACGTSAPKCKRISPVVSRTPGNVVGELNGNCNTTVSLSVPAVNGALSYDWSLPAGTTILSGQGTNAITFTTPSGFTNGQVCVTAFNGCVNSNSRCVYIYGAPAKPIISGPASACAGQTGMAYSCNNTAGATTYTWGAPSGSTIVSGQGTNSVLVDFGAVAGKVAVTAKNACGNRGTATKSVAINCRLSEQENSFDVQLTPNPASVSTDVHLTGNLGDKATITITNVLGKDVYTETFAVSKDKSYHLDLSGYSKGIYLVTVSSGNNKKSMRLVVD